MYIYLVRHAEQESRLCNVNVKLSDKGKIQAKLLGERFKDRPIDIMLSSCLIRAKETADIINEYLKVELKQYENLNEISFGDMEGHDDTYINTNFKEFILEFEKMDKDMKYPNGENGQEVFERVFPIIKELTNMNIEHVAVVTHGGVIRSVICGILGLNQSKRPLLSKSIENTGITTLYYNKDIDRFFLHGFNDYSHLEKDKSLLRNRLSR